MRSRLTILHAHVLQSHCRYGFRQRCVRQQVAVLRGHCIAYGSR
jgi:hypothetical protein